MRILFPAVSRILLLILCLAPSSAKADFSLELNSHWIYGQENQASQWMDATVPGTIHTDLFADKVIPDPFLSINESKVQWVEDKTWVYITSFTLDKKMLREKHIELQFEGLDTYADVYLNDSLLFTAQDMFLSYTKDVKKFARANNTLRVVFHPASELIEKNKMLSPIKNYPGGDRVFIRKAQYQFGWDWGPRLVTCGIWKPVRIIGWSDFRIYDERYQFDYIENGLAYITVEFTLESDKAGEFNFTIDQADTTRYNKSGRSIRGRNTVKFTFTIDNPKLWWCNGLGEPNLYEFKLTTQKKRKKVSISTVTGLRKIELSAERPGGLGTFYFILNGIPVFAKGTNWIPPDNFLPRVNTGKVGQQLTDMRDMNMNMVRVWGGGIYESDKFYSKCDSLGLMVWQDLPFACSMYPLETLNKNNLVMQEVIDNERRIFNHPSIAIWCGDNENLEGWNNWGWQKQMNYSAADSTSIIKEYYQFQQAFSNILKYTYREMPYTQSSPLNGWGTTKAYTMGDVHYWGVWWGMQSFSSYETHTGKFVSEFGFQGLPTIDTYENMGYIAAGYDYQMWKRDTVVKSHQKHPTGFETISTYMKRDYGIDPDALSFDDYIYVSQVMQRDALTAGVESQRSSETCMGSLFWQYNDCWPVASWSVQDYYGRKKLAWYGLKPLYSDLFVTVRISGDSVDAFFVNRSQQSVDARTEAGWYSFSGAPSGFERSIVHTYEPGVHHFYHNSISHMTDVLSADSGYFRAIVYNNDGNSYLNLSTVHLLKKPAECDLPAPKYKINFVRYITEGPCMFTIRAENYMQDVMLSCDDPNAEFSDNGFDLIPGESRQITVKTNNAALVEESIRLTTMNDIVRKLKE